MRKDTQYISTSFHKPLDACLITPHWMLSKMVNKDKIQYTLDDNL